MRIALFALRWLLFAYPAATAESPIAEPAMSERQSSLSVQNMSLKKTEGPAQGMSASSATPRAKCRRLTTPISGAFQVAWLKVNFSEVAQALLLLAASLTPQANFRGRASPFRFRRIQQR